MGWSELAQAVIGRRVELGHHVREAFADASGLSVRTLSDIERARRTSYDPATLARVEQALQWLPDQLHECVAGGLRAGQAEPLDDGLAVCAHADQAAQFGGEHREAFRRRDGLKVAAT
jgi:transcriptional regulator with XRE-family HTH domain